MRSLFTTLFLTILSVIAYSQTQCDPPTNITAEVDIYDIILEWSPPVNPAMKIIDSYPRTNNQATEDASRTVNIVSEMAKKDYLDLQFYWETYNNNGEAGVACDGLNIYTTKWNGPYIYKYDLDGTFIDTIQIDGVSDIRNLVYCETDGYFYGSTVNLNPGIYIIDLNTETLIEHVPITANEGARALGYNSDLDVFYTNNWQTDVLVFDRVTRTVVDTLPLNSIYSSYYSFAYDNISYGGPFLWGFSQDDPGALLVQLNLPDLTETGVVVNINDLVPDSLTGLAGGLFIQQGLVDTTYTLGGLTQNQLVFGIELGYFSPPPPPTITEYNIYRNDILINSNPVSDTSYYDIGLIPGTYNYYTTAVYSDTSGNFLCESDPSNIAIAYVVEPDMILGGNVFAGSTKLTSGMAHAYSKNGDDIIHESSVEIDELGYYFFFPFVENDFYVYTTINENSPHANTYIQTYYGDVFHWEDSPTIHLQNNLYNQDINLIGLQSSEAGLSNISGYVNQNNKGTEPASDVLIILLNNINQVIGTQQTNADGYYNFSNLGYGTYSILCEIIGKSMQPKTVTLEPQNANISHLNFVIHDNEVVLGIGDDLPSSIEFISEIYPNPASKSAKMSLNVTEPQMVSIEFLDVNGRVVDNQFNYLTIGNNELNLKLSKFDSGIIITKILFEDGEMITRKLIVQ